VERRAGMFAIRTRGDKAKNVTGADFHAALADSRATVTAEMEAEYAKIKGELKKRAAEVNLSPVGFLAPGMVSSTRDRKHGG
jgi:transitional endoplasmic reticulum ATPase